MTENTKKTGLSNIVSAAFDWVGAAVIALAIVSVIMTMFCRVVNVSGESMTNTLQPNERLILSSVCMQPTYGDIVVINQDNDEPLIKRVIGLEGDKIFIDNTSGIVYRNGEPLDEPYVRGGYTTNHNQQGAVTVPEGCVYVLGDNRPVSRDSRSSSVGCPSLKDVAGVVTFRLTPFESL